MRHTLAWVLLAVAGAAAPAAAWASAPERLIAEGRVENLQAGGGWVSWVRSGSQFMWHDGESRISHAPFVHPLGTDAGGRGVGLYVGCGSEACEVRHLLLPHGAISTRFTTDRNLAGIDEHRGSFILGFSGKGHPGGIYLRRRGEQSLRRLTKVRPSLLSISTHAMTNLRPGEDLYAASRDRPHRWRRLASDSDPDFVRGASGAVFVDDAQASGRYAYWLETRFDNGENGDPINYATRILRVDPGPSHRHVEYFNARAPRDMGSFAVTGGNLFFTDKATGDLYEVRHPSFLRSGDPIPIP
jgi:hypothetical protein